MDFRNKIKKLPHYRTNGPKPDCGEDSYVGNHKLENRRVLITGGDSGIGRAAAIAFAREGADIALHFSQVKKRRRRSGALYTRSWPKSRSFASRFKR